MKMSKYFIILFNFIILGAIYAQPTVGVMTLKEGAYEGYTFFSPFSGTKAYLVDNCGRLINVWDRGSRPGLAAYFLEDGTILRTYKPNTVGPFTSASNSGGIEIVDWNNSVIWQYEINTSTQLSHHDAVKMPNGNILVLTWELTYADELIALGRDPNEISPQNFMWSEKILELKPVGVSGAEIVWEWHINDHYIQNFDPTKANYGEIEDHPELFNINFPALNSGNSNSSRDWNHFNAIDYNEDLDQILISVRNSDEVWIIDHSTTIEEAANHEGGISGKGGDILYRWGNPNAYNRGPISIQKLFGQHGVHWIKKGLNNEGKILIFNNGNGNPDGSYSQVQLLDPEINNGQYIIEPSEPFGPLDATTLYGQDFAERFYSAYMSNAQQLPNGNILINAGSPGRIFEINPSKEIVWDYIIPLFGDVPATQGQTIGSNSNFRAYKFGVDFQGFADKDLSPGLQIELNPEPCSLPVGINSIEFKNFNITYDALSNSLILPNIEAESISVFDQMGRKVFHTKIDRLQVKLPLLADGIYFVHITKNNKAITSPIFISRQ